MGAVLVAINSERTSHSQVLIAAKAAPTQDKNEFNIGTAVGAVQSLPPGIYIAMNGRIWNPTKVKKNVAANRFEPI